MDVVANSFKQLKVNLSNLTKKVDELFCKYVTENFLMQSLREKEPIEEISQNE